MIQNLKRAWQTVNSKLTCRGVLFGVVFCFLLAICTCILSDAGSDLLNTEFRVNGVAEAGVEQGVLNARGLEPTERLIDKG